MRKMFSSMRGNAPQPSGNSAPSSAYAGRYPEPSTMAEQRPPSAPTLPAHPPPKRQFNAILDKYTTYEQVQQSLRDAGLESSNLIIAIDFTKSNEWLGKHSFGGKGLHSIQPGVPNPYQQAIISIARTLECFDDDNLYPCYGFGDGTTNDRHVFHLKADGTPCEGLEEVLQRYGEAASNVKLSGPTSFAPAIKQAMRIVEQSGNQYHILLIIADGQVTSEGPTIDAIVQASQLPLSIVLIGVGDGPWDMMREFDDKLPQRAWDNFQFVNFTHIMQSTHGQPPLQREVAFALAALMEIPEQFQTIRKLQLLGNARGLSGGFAEPLPLPAAVVRANGAAGAPLLQTVDQRSMQSTVSFDYGVLPPTTAAAVPPPAPQLGTMERRLFECPITMDLMTDPVIAADGNTYERAAIETYIAQQSRAGRGWRSPLTNAVVESTVLVPNHALRSAIMEHRDTQARGTSAAQTHSFI